MQVSHKAFLDEHAMIGGAGRSGRMKMTESAEFLTVLSDTLYSNKPRAAMREPLCNAQDANVEAGYTGPIEVTTTDNEITILDHGLGIPHDNFIDVYGTYGLSTKLKSTAAIGGFGLGCKAPFAITPYFTVENCRAGIKSIWACTRGTSATEGFHDISEIVSVPTTESGVKVIIPIEANKRATYEEEIRIAALSGGLNVVMNGEKLPSIDYDKAEKSRMVLIENNYNSRRSLNVHIGRVTYPVSPDMQDQNRIDGYKEMTALLSQTNLALIIMAEPGELSIAPSRESLGYDDTTVTNLGRMIRRALDLISAAVLPNAMKDAKEIANRKIEADRAQVARGLAASRFFQSFHSSSYDFVGTVLPETGGNRSRPKESVYSYSVGDIAKAFGAHKSVLRRLGIYDKIEASVRRWFYRELAKRFPAYRKAYYARQANADVIESIEKVSVREFVRKDKAVKYAIDNNLGDAVFIGSSGGYSRSTVTFEKLTAMQKKSDRRTPLHVILSPSQFKARAVFNRVRKSGRGLTKVDMDPQTIYEGCKSDVVFLILGLKTKSEDVTRITADLEALGYVVSSARFPKKDPGKLYQGIGDLRISKNGFDRILIADPSLKKPEAYLRFADRDRVESLGYYESERVIALRKTHPNTMIVWTDKQEEAAMSENIPNITDIIFKHAEAKLKDKSWLYAYMRSDLFHSQYEDGSGDNLNTANLYARSHYKIAQLLFPVKGIKEVLASDVTSLMSMIDLMLRKNFVGKDGHLKNANLEDFADRAKSATKELLPDYDCGLADLKKLKEVEAKFAFLRHINITRYHKLEVSDENAPRYCQLIRAARRIWPVEAAVEAAA